MRGKKNDFSMTFYNGEERRLFLEYVHDTEKAINWANSKGIEWTHAMVYNRRTREKVDRIININSEPYKGEIIREINKHRNGGNPIKK